MPTPSNDSAATQAISARTLAHLLVGAGVAVWLGIQYEKPAVHLAVRRAAASPEALKLLGQLGAWFQRALGDPSM